MAWKLEYNPDGTQITDEQIVATGAVQQLAHDNVFDVEIWTGPNKTGTKLIEGTDYTLGNFDTFYKTYNSITFNSSYAGQTLYATYKTKGDYIEAADMNELYENKANKNLDNVEQTTLLEKLKDIDGKIPADISGNADTASKLKTPINITLSGAVNGSISGVDGSSDIVIDNITVQNDSHTHDERYYTEAEIDAMLAGLSVEGHSHYLNQLLDVNVPTPAQNDVLVYNGTEWTNAAQAPDADTVDGKHAADLANVDLSNVADNIVLTKATNVVTLPPLLPHDSVLYLKDSLVDKVQGLKPEGYDGSSITSYGLRTNGTTLVVTERTDDRIHPGVKSFAVETGTTNLWTIDSNPITFNWWGGSGQLPEVVINEVLPSHPDFPGGPVFHVRIIGHGSGWNSSFKTSPIISVTEGQAFTSSVYFKVIEQSSVTLYPNWLIFTNSSGIWTTDNIGITYGNRNIATLAAASGDASCRVEPNILGVSEGTVLEFYWGCPQLETKPFATSFTEGTRGDGILKFTNPLPLDNFVINLWFTPTRYPTQTGQWWRLFDVSYNAGANRGIGLIAAPTLTEGIPANALSLILRDGTTTQRYNLGFDLSAEIGKWHMLTLISNGSIVDVYIDGEKRVSATNDVQRSAIEFIIFGRYFANISGTGMDNGFLMANVLFASYNPNIWTDAYIQYIYRTQSPFYI